MSNAVRDANRVPCLVGVSSADSTTIVPLKVNPTTGRLLVHFQALGSDIAVATPPKRDANNVPVLAGERSDTSAVVSMRTSTNGLLIKLD